MIVAMSLLLALVLRFFPVEPNFLGILTALATLFAETTDFLADFVGKVFPADLLGSAVASPLLLMVTAGLVGVEALSMITDVYVERLQ